MKQINEAFTPEESEKIYVNFLAIVNDKKRRDRLVSKHGKNAEAVAYGTAVNQVKKQAENPIEEPPTEEIPTEEPTTEEIPTKEPTTEEPMENNKLKEMVKAALSKPLDEKKKSSSFTSQYDDKFSDKRKNLPDGLQKSILKKQGNLDEDLDLGHEDNEPHMLKADLYRIGKYAMELYKMVDKFDNSQEVDFPHWWQAKIINAKSCLVSAKHYLDFELKEPQIDTMVDVASEEGALDEEMTPEKSRKKGMPFKDKIKEAILFKLKESKGEYAQIEKKIADLKSKGKNAGDVEMKKLIARRAKLEKSTKEITEGLFDRFKAGVKGAAAGVGQSVKNIGAAIKGDVSQFAKTSDVVAGTKLAQKTKTLGKELDDVIKDLNIMFPKEKLSKNPKLKDAIEKYIALLNQTKTASVTISAIKPTTGADVQATTTQSAPKTPTPQAAPKATTTQSAPKQFTPEKPSTPKTLTVKPTSSKQSTRDEKGRFISNKK
jgi:hypothetical protein